jgi:hypothetical protein
MSSHPSEICANCHFLALRTLNATVVLTSCFSEEERTQFRNGDYSIVKSGTVIPHCHLGVWSTPTAAGRDDVVEYLTPQIRKEVFDTDRREFCFYLPHHPGMGLAAGEMLEKRKSEARESKREHKLALWGLWIAAVALLVQAVLAVIAVVVSAYK